MERSRCSSLDLGMKVSGNESRPDGIWCSIVFLHRGRENMVVGSNNAQLISSHFRRVVG